MKTIKSGKSGEWRVTSDQADNLKCASKSRHATRDTRRTVAFTLIELLVVIAIMGVLSAFLLAVVGGVKKRQYVLTAQSEMEQLTTALERYKAAFGFYPPSPATPPTVGVGNEPTLVNQLYYELEGTTYDPVKQTYTTLDGRSTIDAAKVPVVFPGIGGFMNCTKPGAGEDSPKARDFLPDLRPKQMTIPPYTNSQTGINGVILLLCSVGGPDQNYQPLIPGVADVNPWRYNSSSPTNNPGSYDLWVQLAFGGNTNLVCNWSKSVQINKYLLP